MEKKVTRLYFSLLWMKFQILSGRFSIIFTCQSKYYKTFDLVISFDFWHIERFIRGFKDVLAERLRFYNDLNDLMK
jgi:hypothetical protein